MIDIIQVAHAATEAATQAAAETHANPGIAGMFGIDWKLFIAQLVNFSIVLFVLWKWVFTPVTNALSARTERIENSLKDANRIEKEKKEFETWQAKSMSEARSEASKIVADAEVAAEKVRADLLNKARLEQEQIIADGKKHLLEEQEKLVNSAKIELAGIVVNATEKILKEKLDAKKDKQLIADSLMEALK